jgi:predicted TIM-barrel fold metal-dependent hydrolase
MIIDIHSHAWQYPGHFNDDFRRQAILARGGQEVDLTVRYEDYRKRLPPGEEVRTVVFGGKAKLSGIWVDDRYIADYVKQDPAHLLGFLSVDPTQPGWEKELRQGHQELGLKGIKLLSMYAGFNPDDRKLDPLYDYAQKNKLPVLLHTGTTFVAQAPLECTLPRRLDDVAVRFPELKLIMAHLSHPYEGECIAVIRKHPNVYADISALHYRPFQLFHSLMLLQEYGVWHKLLFGTDYPFTDVAASVEGIRNLNNMLEGTALPRLKTDEIEKMIHRDSLKLLGLEQ